MNELLCAFSAEKKKSKKGDESDAEPDDGTEEDGEEEAEDEEEEDEEDVDDAKPKKTADKKKPDAKKDVDTKPAKNANSTKADKETEKPAADAPTTTDEKAKKESVVNLGEITKINSYITNTKVESLQILHTVCVHQPTSQQMAIKSQSGIIVWRLSAFFQICYDTVAKPAHTLKKNLRKFEGFEFDADSDDYKKKLESVQKVDLAKLKAVCDGLSLDKKGMAKQKP